MTEKIKNVFNFLLRFGLSAALLAFVFSKIDTGKTVDVLKSADITYIVFGAVIFLGINLLLLWRWFVFIRALDLSASALSVTRYFFAGLFGNLFLPSAIGGDIIKIVGLCKDSTQKPRVVASVLLDRLSGFASIVVVAVCAYIFGYKLIDDKILAVLIAIMAGGSGCIVAVLFNERIYEFGCRIFNKLPKFKQALMNMHYDIVLLKDKWGEGLKAIGISCLSQTTLAFIFFLIARGLHQDISLIYFLIFVPMICVASAVPSIGGLGVREFGAASLFGMIGVDSGIAVSITLISFLYMVIVGLIGGLFYVSTLSSGRVQHHQSVAPASEA